MMCDGTLMGSGVQYSILPGCPGTRAAVSFFSNSGVCARGEVSQAVPQAMLWGVGTRVCWWYQIGPYTVAGLLPGQVVSCLYSTACAEHVWQGSAIGWHHGHVGA